MKAATRPTWLALATIAAALAIARPAQAQCSAPLPCDAATAEHTVCVDSDYVFFEGLPNPVRVEDQTSDGTAFAESIRPRVSGSSEASAGYLALRADSTIVALPPGILRAEINVEAYWRRPIVIAGGSFVGPPIGTMVGLFGWEGDLEQNAVPLTNQGDIPLNGARAAARLRVGAQDETCQVEIAGIERVDSLCSGRREVETGPCSGNALVDELYQIEIPFTVGVPFQLYGFARIETDVINVDADLADDFFGGARADFGSTGRWMGILEVRDFSGTPVADYTVTDLATGDVDWTQPVPAPELGAATQGCVALAFLAWLTRRRRCCCRAGRVVLLCTLVAGSARADVEWVPRAEGDDFEAKLYARAGEYGSLCGGSCDYEDEDHAVDTLVAGLPSFGSRAAEIEVSAGAAGSAHAHAMASYSVSWEELGPNSHVGHVEIEIRGQTATPAVPPAGERNASTETFARAMLCFRVEDQPVTLRLVGTTQGVLSDLYPAQGLPDEGLLHHPAGDFSVPAGSGAFDSGSLALLPQPGPYCINAFLLADESIVSVADLESPPQTDASSFVFDFTILPVPEPGAGAAVAAAIASLCLLRSRRVRRNGSAALAVATLLVAANPAHALVRFSTQYPPSAYVASSFELIDSSSPECLEEFCLAQLRDLATFALLDTTTSTVSFEDAVPGVAAELDQSYAVQFTFEDTPLGPTLAGGSASITSASRGIAAASPVSGLGTATMTGMVGLNWTVEVTASVYLYVFGSATLIGGPLADREIGDPTLCPPLPIGVLCELRPYPRVSVDPRPFHFAPYQESELGAFDSGELVLAPGVYGFLAVAGNANVVPIVADTPETHLVQEDLDFEFVIVPVPEPGALLQGLAVLAALLLSGLARPARAFIAVDPVSAACHRSDPEAAPFDLSLRARLYEADECPGPGQCEDEIDERSQNDVPAIGGFDDALGRDMDADGPASGEVRVGTSAAWSYAEQVFGEETGQSLAAGTLEMSLLVEFVVPDGMRAASAVASARGCYCFEVTELPALLDPFVTVSNARDAGYELSPNALIFVELPGLGSLILPSGTLDPEPQWLDPGSYCLSAETASETSMGNDGMSHDMSIAAEVAISYTIVPAPESSSRALLATAAATLAGLGARRR